MKLWRRNITTKITEKRTPTGLKKPIYRMVKRVEGQRERRS
jgi:ferric iron reductase protein FhuF